MVMERFGTDVQKIFEKVGRKFSRHTVCALALRLVGQIPFALFFQIILVFPIVNLHSAQTKFQCEEKNHILILNSVGYRLLLLELDIYVKGDLTI